MTAPVRTQKEQQFLDNLNARLEELTNKHAVFKGMIYGESGVGKTIAAMQLAQAITPPDKHIILVDSGQGWVSLNDFPELKKRTRSFKILELPEFEKLAQAIEGKVNEYWGSIGTIVIDEYSTFAAYDLLQVTRARAIRSESFKDADEPKQPDMGVSNNRMKRFTGPLIQLSETNVIFVAHQRTDKDNMNVPVISPAFMPGFGSHLRGVMHVVAYMTANEEMTEEGNIAYTREVQVNPTKKVVAKTRIGGYSGVRITVEELIKGVAEWLSGKRDTDETDTIMEDPIVDTAPTEDTIDTIDSIMSEIEGE